MKHCAQKNKTEFKQVSERDFEITKEERIYAVRDSIFFQEFDEEKNSYTGNEVERIVAAIDRDNPALKKGWIILEFEERI